MNEYYPDYKDNELFIHILNSLPSQIRTEEETIVKLYNLIISLISSQKQLLACTQILPKESLIKIFSECNNHRKDIIKILGGLNFNTDEIRELILKLVSKLNTKVLISGKDLDKEDEIEYNDFFIESWENLNKILSKDLNLNENYVNIDRNLYKDLIRLIQFCINNNIDNIYSFYNYKPLNDLIKYIEDIPKSDLKKTVNTRKKSKIVPIRPGELNSDIKFKLITTKAFMEEKIKEHIIKINSDNIKEFDSNIAEISQNYQENYSADVNYVINFYVKTMKIIDLFSEISRDLSESNLQSKLDLFIDNIYASTQSLDDLYYVAELFNQGSVNDEIKITERINTLNTDSNFFIKCNEIITNKKIESEDQKQLLLENFILSYEREFINNLIYNVDLNINNYKLLARIYRHSTPHFNNRIDSIIKQNLRKN